MLDNNLMKRNLFICFGFCTNTSRFEPWGIPFQNFSLSLHLKKSKEIVEVLAGTPCRAASRWLAWQPRCSWLQKVRARIGRSDTSSLRLLRQNNLRPADCWVFWCLLSPRFPQSWWLTKLDEDLYRHQKNEGWSLHTEIKEIRFPLFACIRN